MDRKQHVSSIVTDSPWPTLQDMYTCYDEFKHNKKYSYTRISFELNLANNISKLYREIHSKTYSLSKSCCFIVTKPKAREIFAASYKDRVMNHLVVKELLKIWTPKFSPHSFACIKNRGLHKTFFPTVHRPTIYKLLMDSINNTIIFPTEKLNTLKYLTDVILQHDARSNFFISKHDISLSKYLNPDKSWINQDQNHGMPIGDLISQLCANIILTELDHYISSTLSPSIYLRYVDDLLLLDTNKDALHSFIEKIDTWLQTKRYQCLDKIILCP